MNPRISGYEITTSKHKVVLGRLQRVHVLRHQKGMSIVTRGSEGIMGNEIATLDLLVTVKKSMSDSLGQIPRNFPDL